MIDVVAAVYILAEVINKNFYKWRWLFRDKYVAEKPLASAGRHCACIDILGNKLNQCIIVEGGIIAIVSVCWYGNVHRRYDGRRRWYVTCGVLKTVTVWASFWLAGRIETGRVHLVVAACLLWPMANA